MASLKTNTIYLYLLTASNYLFGLATLPYVTRVLGPEEYGGLGFAMAFGTYFFLIIDFGFILLATRQITLARNDSLKLNDILSQVTYTKLFISLVLFGVLVGFSYFVPQIKSSLNLILLFLGVSIVNNMIPDFLYRGLESMRIVTIRGIISKGIATCMTFIFLRHSGQAYMVPLFQICGSIVAFCWILYDMIFHLKLRYVAPSFRRIILNLRYSFQFFISRVAASVYGVANIMVLGFVMPGSSVIGYYSSAEKFKDLGTMSCSPIADSLYPYMIRERNYHTFFKILFILEIIVLVCCTIGTIWAKEFCIIVFGEDFAPSAEIVRWFMPIIAIILPSYLLGFPALTPIDKAKWANYSVIIAMLNQVCGITILLFLNSVTAVNLCKLTLMSELLCLLIRIMTLYRSRKLLKDIT